MQLFFYSIFSYCKFLASSLLYNLQLLISCRKFIIPMANGIELLNSKRPFKSAVLMRVAKRRQTGR